MKTLIDSKILIVDDDYGVRESFRILLATFGIKVAFIAASGREALDILSKHSTEIDLAIVDNRMPGITGLDLIKELTLHHKTMLKIVMITGFATLDTAIEFFQLGSEFVKTVNFMTKPVDVDGFINLIRSELGIALEDADD